MSYDEPTPDPTTVDPEIPDVPEREHGLEPRPEGAPDVTDPGETSEVESSADAGDDPGSPDAGAEVAPTDL